MADRIFGWLAKAAALFTLGMLIAILVSLTVRTNTRARSGPRALCSTMLTGRL